MKDYRNFFHQITHSAWYTFQLAQHHKYQSLVLVGRINLFKFGDSDSLAPTTRQIYGYLAPTPPSPVSAAATRWLTNRASSYRPAGIESLPNTVTSHKLEICSCLLSLAFIIFYHPTRRICFVA